MNDEEREDNLRQMIAHKIAAQATKGMSRLIETAVDSMQLIMVEAIKQIDFEQIAKEEANPIEEIEAEPASRKEMLETIAKQANQNRPTSVTPPKKSAKIGTGAAHCIHKILRTTCPTCKVQ